MYIDLKNGLIMEKHTVTCTEITNIWNHKYDTNSKAQPIEWRYVLDVPVVRLVGGFYRESFFDGIFELASVALPVDILKDKLRVEVKKIRRARTGTKHSDETKAKQSLLKKGKPSKRLGSKLSDKTKEKLRQANLGKKLSLETKSKIAASGKGRTMSAEAKAKISAANKGKVSNRKGITGFKTSEATKEKLRAINKGKTLSEETKIKMSEAQKAAHAKSKRVVSEETKAKIREKLKGKKLSDETRRKMSESRRKKQ